MGLEYRVRSKAFPISASSRFATQRTHNWTQLDVDAFTSSFFANRGSSSIHENLVERSSSGDACRECSIVYTNINM
jgi:hypothetical protein